MIIARTGSTRRRANVDVLAFEVLERRHLEQRIDGERVQIHLDTERAHTPGEADLGIGVLVGKVIFVLLDAAQVGPRRVRRPQQVIVVLQVPRKHDVGDERVRIARYVANWHVRITGGVQEEKRDECVKRSE